MNLLLQNLNISEISSILMSKSSFLVMSISQDRSCSRANNLLFTSDIKSEKSPAARATTLGEGDMHNKAVTISLDSIAEVYSIETSRYQENNHPPLCESLNMASISWFKKACLSYESTSPYCVEFITD